MLQKITRPLAYLNVFRFLRWLWYLFTNWLRRFKKVDYVLFTLPGAMPSLPEKRPWLMRRLRGDPPMSQYELDEAFQRVANDPRVKGVILHMRGGRMGLADLQTLRQSIVDLRASGKRVVCFSASDYNLDTYFVASAADEILIQQIGGLLMPGLQRTAGFLKDALAAIGVQFEVVAIAPYKTAGDMLALNAPTPEFEEQVNRIMDSSFDILVEGIAEGRNMAPDAVRAMIDSAIHLDQEALDVGYVDGMVSEENLAQHLGVKHILAWDQAKKTLYKQWRKKHSKYIALVRIGGMIVDGESGKPPVPLPIPILGNERAGDLTVVQHVRRVIKDKRAAALVLFVDSGGGSASSSEAMAAALREFNKTRPVVVYMSNVAASGGYWVSTPGRWIVAQPGTITGSIGVIMGKVVNQEMYTKLHINRVEFKRGENAGIFAGTTPFTDAQRTRMRESVVYMYNAFTALVAGSRNLTQEAVDAVGGGRVWTGVQALDHGLVDELGGLDVALKKARELADLPTDAPLVFPTFKGKPLPPELVEQANPAAVLQYIQDGVQAVGSGKAQLIMPFTLD